MKKIYALTLIETLIAILVFGIGILVVLQGLSQTIRNQEYANMQIKSAFLAREGIELMFNLRDANYRKELPWNCIFNKSEPNEPINENENPFCVGYFGSGDENNVLKIGIGSGEYIHVETGNIEKDDFDANFSGFQIYFHTGNVLNDSTGFRYDYTGNEDEATWFARYLLITGVNYEEDKPLDKDKLLKIESHVLYKKGYLTGEKVMETFIGNYEF